MFLPPATLTPPGASPRIAQRAAAKEPPLSARWWPSLLHRCGILHSDAAITPSDPPPEQPGRGFEAEIELAAAAKVFHFPDVSDADPAASFWAENRLSAGESVQVYGSAQPRFLPAEYDQGKAR
jgi:hypothetical protein